VKELVRRFDEGESGIALVQLALLAIVMMLFTAFAVDLGWFFLNANKIQRAADNAALAGVVYMPDQTPIAVDRAGKVAEANGYLDGDDGAVLTIVPQPDGKKNQLEVTVTDTVETFFLKVIGRDTQTISRTGRAEYIRPLPMGSPVGRFGNDASDGSVDCSGPDPCFWANIHGPFTNTGMGDAFSSYCAYGQGWGGSNGSACAEGQDHRSSRGYVYGVQHAGGSLTVQIQNGSFEQGGDDGTRTGDNNSWCVGDVCEPGPNTRVRVYAPDPTPLTLDSSGILCSKTYPAIPAPADPAVYAWDTVCSIAAAPGLYAVEVEIVDDPATPADDAGLNRYSLRVGAGDSISALGDMAIYTNVTGNTEFFLAQVDDGYAGRTLNVELYDPGDAAAGVTNIIKLRSPDGTTWTGGCDVSIRPHGTADFVSLTSIAPGSPCQIDATRPTNNYDGDWLRMEVDLPEAYTCTDCWWKIRYEYNDGGTPANTNDTTTWRAYISGSPVRLILGG
jgi:hypothetical protein